MPVVKKLKPGDFIVNRDVIISALFIHNSEFLKDKTQKITELEDEFYKRFNIEHHEVINNISPIWDLIIKEIDISQNDISTLNKAFERYIDLLEKSRKQPLRLKYNLRIGMLGGSEASKRNNSLWLYNENFYIIRGHYSDDEIRLLILEESDKERIKFEKLRAKFDDLTSDDLNYSRPRIPEKVRIEIWRRDGGKCARCGSRVNLEYDHIVPISKGGSNTARNIELLCEKHNRSKSNNVV